MVFNMDETMLEVSKSHRVKVVVPRDMPYPKKRAEAAVDCHITLVLCVSADGTHLDPTVILPLKTFPKDCIDMAGAYNWAGQKEGWITEHLFEQWVRLVFIPHLEKIRENKDMWDEPALLFLDGHSSRSSPQALEWLSLNNVVTVTIPGHTSHILQPMDTGINGAFKNALRKYKRFDKGATASDKRRAILSAALHALHDAFYPEIVKRSWKQSGLWPWSPGTILDDPNLVSQAEVEPKPKSSRSSLKISGRILTTDDAIAEMKEVKSRRST